MKNQFRFQNLYHFKPQVWNFSINNEQIIIKNKIDQEKFSEQIEDKSESYLFKTHNVKSIIHENQGNKFNFMLDNYKKLIQMDIKYPKYQHQYGNVWYSNNQDMQDYQVGMNFAQKYLKKVKTLELDFNQLNMDLQHLSQKQMEGFLYFSSLWGWEHKITNDIKKLESKSINELNLINDNFSTSDASKTLSKSQARQWTRIQASLRNNIGTPKFYADWAVDQFKDLKPIVIKGDELLTHKLRGIHAVGRGATKEREPYFLHFKYNGNPDTDEYLSLVGKGVCYDTGGLSLKSNPKDMFLDKCGAINSLSALKQAVDNKVKINLSCTVFFLENAIGPDCYQVDEILELHDGKTVRIGNTDAEGRLGLYDCLSWVQSESGLKIKQIVEQSTLTGAAVAMMNFDQTPFQCNDEELAGIVRESSLKAFEPAWIQPLTLTSASGMKHDIADQNNITSKRPQEGSSSAASFLFNAIKEGVKYAHIDIACATSKGDYDLNKFQSNGFGTGILVNIIDSMKSD